jgi:hypothetical protein
MPTNILRVAPRSVYFAETDNAKWLRPPEPRQQALAARAGGASTWLESLEHLRGLKSWQLDDKARSWRVLALNLDRTTMLLDDLLHDAQT